MGIEGHDDRLMGLRLPPSGFTDRTAAIAGVRYASWLRRLGAFAIDLLILYTIEYVLGAVLSFTPNVVGAHLLTALYYFLLIGGIGIVYATLCLDRLHGQTPGMAALRIRCVPVRRYGDLSTAQCLTRAVVASLLVNGLLYVANGGWALSFVAGLAVIVLYLWPLVDGRRQTLWDHVARTVVLDDRF